ncbi:hypothetical protein BgiBS90_005116 [Biomphalaria glabrata]|nr:hypothetical protein BgiBS90_005116 [Biomphalaria glabrata]
MNCTFGASHREFRCQKNHKLSIDKCQSIQDESELARGRQLQLELADTYLLDERLLAEDDRGALDFVYNFAACEPKAPLRGVCREGLLKQRVQSTAVLSNKTLNTISLSVKQSRHCLKNRMANWKKRK